MNYLQYSAARRKRIEAGLRAFFKIKEKEAVSIRFHRDALAKLLDFSLRGKLMRGIFVHVTYEMCGGRQPARALNAACAIEITHTGLLIHDDIMDQDELRRGVRTIYMQYADSAKKAGIQNDILYGQSMGISAADVAFFLGFELLSSSTSSTSHYQKMMSIFSKEMVRLGVAQMEDVHLGSLKSTPTIDEVIEMYRYKSARYSFSLPFELGALLAGSSKDICTLLASLGEQIGIIFQLKDDEIGLFETSKAIGKSAGIDILSNKKTLHRTYCLQSAPPVERRRLLQIFGNPGATQADIQYVMQTMIKYNIKEQVAEYMAPYEKEAYRLIGRLETKGMNTKMLRGIVELNMNRKK